MLEKTDSEQVEIKMQTLQQLDEYLSTPFFTIELPLWGEWCLSVPASVFGSPLLMSIFSLFFAAAESSLITALLTFELLVFVLAWIHFVPQGKIRQFFQTNATLPVFIVGNLLSIQYLSPKSFGASCFFVSGFSVVVAIVAILKRATKRLRPNFAVRARGYKSRALPIGPTAIQSTKSEKKKIADQHAALPSGDAASCACFVTVYLLQLNDKMASSSNISNSSNEWNVGCAVSTVVLFLCCSGRMYWRHHHFLDVCAGSLVGIFCTSLLHLFLGGFRECGWLTTLVSALIGAGLNEFTAS